MLEARSQGELTDGKKCVLPLVIGLHNYTLSPQPVATSSNEKMTHVRYDIFHSVFHSHPPALTTSLYIRFNS